MSRNAWVQLDPSLQRTVEGMIEAANPAAKRAIDKCLRPVYDVAYARWPVKTGNSKALLTLSYDLVGPGVSRTRIRSGADYTGFINKGRTAQDLLVTPWKKAIEEIADQFGEELAAAAGRRP